MKFRNMFAVIASAAGLSWWLSRQGGELQSEIGGKAQTWRWRNFDVNFAVAGQGAPLVLIHGIYPGASSAQWERNFYALSRSFQVFSPDLPGFGMSSRPVLDYRPELYTELIRDFLNEVVGKPAMVLASGHTAACAINVAARSPELIRMLILDTPVGLTRFANTPSLNERLMYQFWRLPVAGTLAYFTMVSKQAIALYLRTNGLGDPKLVNSVLVSKIHRQAHQPGAKWAPIAMLGGRLNQNVGDSYAALEQPILLLWGEMPSYIPITDAREFLNLNDRAKLQIFNGCRLMPEFEQPVKFNTVIEEWVGAIERAEKPAAGEAAAAG